jgi:hypothetical protein
MALPPEILGAITQVTAVVAHLRIRAAQGAILVCQQHSAYVHETATCCRGYSFFASVQ